MISIGNHIVEYPIFLAPMAGITDLPFRNVVSHFKTGHFVSEMIASELLSGRPGTLQRLVWELIQKILQFKFQDEIPTQYLKPQKWLRD